MDLHLSLFQSKLVERWSIIHLLVDITAFFSFLNMFKVNHIACLDSPLIFGKSYTGLKVYLLDQMVFLITPMAPMIFLMFRTVMD